MKSITIDYNYNRNQPHPWFKVGINTELIIPLLDNEYDLLQGYMLYQYSMIEIIAQQ